MELCILSAHYDQHWRLSYGSIDQKLRGEGGEGGWGSFGAHTVRIFLEGKERKWFIYCRPTISRPLGPP